MTEPSQYFKGRTVQEQMNEVIGYVDTRAAEVATDAIASDVAQVHQDMLDADADAAAAAASAAAAAGTLANAVKKTGEASQSIDGDIDLNDDLNVDGDATVGGALAVTGAVTVPTPVNNTDAATKKYVDDADALKMNIADINSYAVGLTGNQGPIAGNKQFLSAYKYRKSIITFGSAVAGWRKLWTFTGRCSIRMSSMSVAGQYRSVGSADYMVEFYSATMNNSNNRQTIVSRSVASDNMIIANTYNARTDEEVYCIYGRVAPSSNAVFMITEAFNEDGTAKTNFIESNDNTSYQLTDIGTNVTIGASL